MLAQPTGDLGTGFGIHWVDVPAEYADDPRANRFLLDHVPPGASFSRRLGVVNYAAEPIEVDFAVVAAEARAGEYVIREGVNTPVLDWVTVEPSTVSVPANEEVFATANFEIPADAPEGEQLGVLFAASTTATGQLEVVSRVGLRIYLSVGPGGAPPSNFSITEMSALRTEEGAPVVHVRVQNTGGRVVDVGGSLQLLDGPGGLRAGPFEVTEPATIGTGESAIVAFELSPELPDGPWLARAELRSGLLERAAEARLTFPSESGQSAQPVAAEEVPLHQDRGFLVPLAIGLTLLALFLLLLFWWFFLRRRRDEQEDELAPRPARHGTGVGG